MTLCYPSDITREQFELIRSELKQLKKQTKPRTVDLYDCFCAVLYMLTSSCQWRLLPHDYPKWTTVYFYYRQWSKANDEGLTVLDKVLKKIGRKTPRPRWAD